MFALSNLIDLDSQENSHVIHHHRLHRVTWEFMDLYDQYFEAVWLRVISASGMKPEEHTTFNSDLRISRVEFRIVVHF